MASVTITVPNIGIAARTAAPGALQAAIKAAMDSAEAQRRAGASGVQDAIKAATDNIETQRRAG